jgi:dTDP-4-dehydrorhamnose reductase
MDGTVLVTGAAGQLGTFIVKAFADRHVIATTRASLDITDTASVRRVVSETKPSLIVNCVAFNDVDGAEDAPTSALAANAFGVRALAQAAEAGGATFVHYSTDFVFDGTASRPYEETSSPGPRSTYAASKLLGEWFALDVPGTYVLRVESLFGNAPGWTGRRGTLDNLVDGLRNGRELRQAAPGLYHCVNSGQATWQEVTEEAARLLGVTPRLRPTTVDQVPMRAHRPRFCALSNRKLAAAGFVMPAWQDALTRWLSAGSLAAASR